MEMAELRPQRKLPEKETEVVNLDCRFAIKHVFGIIFRILRNSQSHKHAFILIKCSAGELELTPTMAVLGIDNTKTSGLFVTDSNSETRFLMDAGAQFPFVAAKNKNCLILREKS